MGLSPDAIDDLLYQFVTERPEFLPLCRPVWIGTKRVWRIGEVALSRHLIMWAFGRGLLRAEDAEPLRKSIRAEMRRRLAPTN